MKCPVCWADKAYVRRVEGWKRVVLACLLIVPMKCHHCYYKFYFPWPLTLGKSIQPPPPRVIPIRSAARSSHAASHYAATRAGQEHHTGRSPQTDSTRPKVA